MNLMRAGIGKDGVLTADSSRQKGAGAKKAGANAGLHSIAQIASQGSMRRLRGRVLWEGNLAQSSLRRPYKSI
jgi:hypothetical protein